MNACLHPIGSLRQSKSFPDKYVTCPCGELFMIDRLVDFHKAGGLTTVVLWTCLSAMRDWDTRPLAECLAQGTTLDYVQGKENPQTALSEDDPKWGH